MLFCILLFKLQNYAEKINYLPCTSKFRFFGNTVVSTMESYLKEGLPEFQGCEATISFIRRMNEVVDAMNSQRPCEALRPDPETKHHKVNKYFYKILVINCFLIFTMQY